ncbi:MAG: hypothetical protein RBG13Loki_1268 [Promethearchaeota archaeon CR_4]|nr:MAG: hypothetical protein RBG13Loki_1268 [Candidatus Lokiarchaeota archaeon CR_4]
MDLDDPAKALKHVLSGLIDVALRTPDQILRRRNLTQWSELEQQVFYALLDDPSFPLKRHKEGFHVSDPANLICHAASHFDLQQLSVKLTWQEFEKLVTNALEQCEFKVVKNFHFTAGARKKRWEVDVIGIRGPHLIAFDAKHWTRTTQAPSALEKAASNQKARVAALAGYSKLGDLLFQLGITHTRLTLVPAIVTLFDPPFELAQCGVPAMSIRNLSYFLQHFEVIFPKIWTIPAGTISLQRRLI